MSTFNPQESHSDAESTPDLLGIEGLRNMMKQPEFFFQGKSPLPFNQETLDQYLQGKLLPSNARQVEQAILSGDVWAARFLASQIDHKVRTGEISNQSLNAFDKIIGMKQ